MCKFITIWCFSSTSKNQEKARTYFTKALVLAGKVSKEKKLAKKPNKFNKKMMGSIRQQNFVSKPESIFYHFFFIEYFLKNIIFQLQELQLTK